MSKPTKEQLETQHEQLKKFLEEAEYKLELEDGLLLHQLQIHLTVFDLVMNRTICDGFDPLYEDERKAVHDFWYQLSNNLKTALELLEMADHTVQGLRYDADEKGHFIPNNSLRRRMTENES